MPFELLHFRLPVSSKAALATRAPNASCTTGGFITSPSQGQIINFPGASPLNISWDSTCLSSTSLDIYLYAFTSSSDTSSASTRVHLYTDVPNSISSYSAPIKPKWWNATASPQTSLQLLIVPKGDPPFLSTLPAGPVFIASYTPPSDGSLPDDANPNISDKDGGITSFTSSSSSSLQEEKKGITPGGKAAAALVPLLFLLLIAIGYYVWKQRIGKKEKSKRFSEMVDKRMSVISADWRSMSAKGGMEAVRVSVYGEGRASLVLGEGMRRSVYGDGGEVVGGGQAGIGALRFNPDLEQYQSHLRHGLRGTMYSTGEGRVASRVSFAADTVDRKSRVSFVDGRTSRYGNGRASRAFHTAFTVDTATTTFSPTYVSSSSPVSHLTNTSNAASNGHCVEEDRDTGSGSMSPTQTVGPDSLSVEDIRKRIAGTNMGGNGNSGDEGVRLDEGVVPALRLMRTGSKQSTSSHPVNENEGSDELLFSPSQFAFDNNGNGNSSTKAVIPVPPAPVHTNTSVPNTPKSPVGIMPVMPDSIMSPDALLRAYADRRATSNTANTNGSRNNTPTPLTLTISSPISVATPYTSIPIPNIHTNTNTNTNMESISPISANYGPLSAISATYGYNRAGVGAGIGNAMRKSASVYSDEEQAYGGHQ